MADLHETEIEGALNELEMKLDRLRALYDQFFQGYERTPPLTLRKDVVRMLNDLQRAEIRRTALRFRLQMSMQRFSQFKTLWNRTEREMDAGSFRRHRKRAETRDREAKNRGELSAREVAEIEAIRMRLGEDAAIEAERKRRAAAGLTSSPTSSNAATRAAEPASSDAARPTAGTASTPGDSSDKTSTDAGQAAADFLASLEGGSPKPAQAAPQEAAPIRGVNADELRSQAARIQFLRERFGMSSAAAAAAAQRTAGAESPKAASTSAPESRPSGDAIDKLYQRLVQTRSSLSSGAPAPDPAKFRSSVEKQAQQLREKHGYKRVDFDVVVKDGKAYIKPIPKT